MAKSEEARKRGNQRRRLKYADNNLEKLAKQQTGEALKQTRREQRRIKRAIKASYYDRDKGKYNTAYEKIEAKLNTSREYLQKQALRNKPKKEIENKRLSEMQKNYFRSAHRTEAQKQANAPLTNQQRLAKAEQIFFFSATRVLWQGGSPEMRYENVVEGLKSYGARLSSGRMVENLQDAVQFVKEQYGDKYPTMDKVKEGYYDFDESETIEDSPRAISRKKLRSLSK